MIDWTDILEVQDHKTELGKLYERMTIEELSEYLGVSRNALRAKMMAEGIPFKPKGGVSEQHQGKSRLDSVPKDLFQTIPPRLIAKQFGMDISAVYKYMRRRGIKREANTRKVVDDEEARLPSEGEVGINDTRIQSTDGDSDIQNRSESRTIRKA